MFITNVEELVQALKPRLQDYLVQKIGDEATNKRFHCFVHDDHDPSMYYNPKNGNQTVHCFSCGASHDIFSACAQLDGLPGSGPEWITQTLPFLAEKLEVEVRLGEPTHADRERARQYKMAADIAAVIETNYKDASTYCESRGWSSQYLTIGSVAIEILKSELLAKGWGQEQLQTSPYFAHDARYFDEDKVTFVINDYRGRPIGFSSKNLNRPEGQRVPKYIGTPETAIYQKRKTLLGIDIALASAKKDGLYVVEGQGDVAALHTHGITNAVATCGTAFTADHLSLLKMLGIRQVFFCMDWDKAGEQGIMRTLRDEIKTTPGVSCWVVLPPETDEKDPGEFLENHDGEAFRALRKQGGFEWLVSKLGEDLNATDLCAELIPVVAAEPSAVRRELLINTLTELTGFSFISISTDVNNLRDGKFEERRGRLGAAAEKFGREVLDDPDNIQALIAEMEHKVSHIESEYKRDTIGVNYQLSRYDALQEQKQYDAEHGLGMGFLMSRFTMFSQAMSGGMTWVDGVLIYFGGRANSGKTATAIALGLDIAITDENAVIIMHFTDDSYSQVEPRLKSNIAEHIRTTADQPVGIGKMANPWANSADPTEWELYARADAKFRELIQTERLILVDSEDGNTLSVLEKQMRYIRQRYPKKKLLVICDNTHNYMDFLQLDQNTRMTRISNYQKTLVGKYRCCMFATAEYRKNSPQDTTKLRLPIDDDLADARALTYRPNMIIHVYNDLHDRKDAAEIVYHKQAGGPAMPRLMLVVSKNKISKFKEKLMLDLDPDTVSLSQYDTAIARDESIKMRDGLANGSVRYSKTASGEMVIEADWED